MTKTPKIDKKLLKKLEGELKILQDKKAIVDKKSGIDKYVEVKVKKNQSRFKRIKTKGQPDKGVGNFYIQLDVTTKDNDILIPLSIASGKRVTGFMYMIEGTDESDIATAEVDVSGSKVTQITVGTLLIAKIPAKSVASFKLKIEIKGKIAKKYNIIINRINYKLDLSDVRYQQYLKPIIGKTVKFS